MKKLTLAMLASALALGAVSAQTASAQTTSNWTGPYVGGKLGVNNAKADGLSSENAFTGGVEAGYNWNLGGPVVGADVFADFNSKTDHSVGGPFPTVRYGSTVWGVDGKLGVDLGPVLPYAKVGIAQTDLTGLSGDDWGFHGGLGVEYKVMPQVGLAGEWTYSEATPIGDRKFKNNNFTVGVNYHF